MWRLDVPHLWFNISAMHDRTAHRQTTVAEAKILAFAKWQLEKRKEDFCGQQVLAQISMRDLAAYCREHWEDMCVEGRNRRKGLKP